MSTLFLFTKFFALLLHDITPFINHMEGRSNLKVIGWKHKILRRITTLLNTLNHHRFFNCLCFVQFVLQMHSNSYLGIHIGKNDFAVTNCRL